jgi:YHS domain-containing protein
VGDPRVLDLLGELESDARALGFERLASIVDQLLVHRSHPTLRTRDAFAFQHIPGRSRQPGRRCPAQARTACRVVLAAGAKLKSATEPVEPGRSKTTALSVEGEPMAYAKDPVCGMEVDRDTDLKTEHDGETYYFCSRGCKLDFEEDPEKYLDPSYEAHM